MQTKKIKTVHVHVSVQSRQKSCFSLVLLSLLKGDSSDYKQAVHADMQASLGLC